MHIPGEDAVQPMADVTHYKNLFLSLLPAVLIHKHASRALSIYLSIYPSLTLPSRRPHCALLESNAASIQQSHFQSPHDRSGYCSPTSHSTPNTHKDLRLRNADLLPRAASRPSNLLFLFSFPSNTRNPNLSSQYTSLLYERTQT